MSQEGKAVPSRPRSPVGPVQSLVSACPPQDPSCPESPVFPLESPTHACSERPPHRLRPPRRPPVDGFNNPAALKHG